MKKFIEPIPDSAEYRGSLRSSAGDENVPASLKQITTRDLFSLRIFPRAFSVIVVTVRVGSRTVKSWNDESDFRVTLDRVIGCK